MGQRLITAAGGGWCLYCVAAFNFIGYLAACNKLKTVRCIRSPKAHISNRRPHHFNVKCKLTSKSATANHTVSSLCVYNYVHIWVKRSCFQAGLMGQFCYVKFVIMDWWTQRLILSPWLLSTISESIQAKTLNYTRKKNAKECKFIERNRVKTLWCRELYSGFDGNKAYMSSWWRTSDLQVTTVDIKQGCY